MTCEMQTSNQVGHSPLLAAEHFVGYSVRESDKFVYFQHLLAEESKKTFCVCHFLEIRDQFARRGKPP